MKANPVTAIQGLADRIARKFNADVLLYNGPIEEMFDHRVIGLCGEHQRRENVILVLVTFGGDGDSAYRIAKCLQSNYKRFTLFVTGYCKSAGTLVALGAHDLIFADHGELGPLDVQMWKEDSLWETQSGLTVNASLTALQSKAYLAFEEFFLETEGRSEGAITVKTAAEIATKLVIGLFAPLYSQVDPIHVGEAARAMQIADHYGRLLWQASRNYDLKTLNHLITHYPSHSFVIDFDEAKLIFKHVRRPNSSEAELARKLSSVALAPLPSKEAVVRFLSSPVAKRRPTRTARRPGGKAVVQKGSGNGRREAGPRTASDRAPAQSRA